MAQRKKNNESVKGVLVVAGVIAAILLLKKKSRGSLIISDPYDGEFISDKDYSDLYRPSDEYNVRFGLAGTKRKLPNQC